MRLVGCGYGKGEAKGDPPRLPRVQFGEAWFSHSTGSLCPIPIGTMLVSRLLGTAPKHENEVAIIDQLSTVQPNPLFLSHVTQDLEACGFKVDVYKGDEVTVDFYRKLPSYGYKLVIFRVHGEVLNKEGKTYLDMGTWLFTNEPYNAMKYVDERLATRVVKARTTENMEGQFDRTVIITMGCYCLYLDDLAEAFVKKGASVYLGWDGNVDLAYVDKATINLIDSLCRKGTTVKHAVDKTMAEIGPDPDWDTRLKCYMAESRDKTIKQLLIK